MDIANKVFLVTGGSDGIGLALARQLHAAGAHVAVCGRSQAKLTAARDGGLEAIAADLSTPAGCDALIADFAGRPLDVLVNNAGMQVIADIAAGAPPAPFETEMFLNFNAPLRLVIGLLPALKARPQAKIVNVTSGLALSPKASAPVYCASKAALRAFSKALRAQLQGTSVSVLDALPPMVDTAMTAGRGKPSVKLSPETCAAAIVRAIGQDRQDAYIGATRLLKIAQRLAPGLAERIMLGMH